MYSGSGYSDWEIGDVDVFIHDGVYHLFHLIIPNHDYIAHASSRDGITWKREKNALFVGHPGEWDDDMLWTMHVSRSKDHFVMYYTGLQRKDRGGVQQIGMAVSTDLIHWQKVQKGNLPIGSQAPHYESKTNTPREWLSFRDPFCFKNGADIYLLICARSSYGPVSRRGCVGVAKLENGTFQLRKPLLYPMVYDDVECPCVFELKGRFYLVGSIREDIKVRYWFAPQFLGEYHSFRADVLLPQGNYAARIVQDGDHLLVYNFFFLDGSVSTLRVLPPPKQLDTQADGQLVLKTFHRWEKMVKKTIFQDRFSTIKSLFQNPTATFRRNQKSWTVGAKSGYEIFAFPKPADSFIWEGKITVKGMGKFGLVTDLDETGNGYFISFDITNGLVQIRAWGFNEANKQSNFIFNNIQSNIFKLFTPNVFDFQLIRYGNYIELSINDLVKLTLIDYTYSGGYIGLYSASSIISLSTSQLKVLPNPQSEYASQEEMQ
ncbi:MAG: glycosyl hydrolase family 32 [Bacteroidota bacterium]